MNISVVVCAVLAYISFIIGFPIALYDLYSERLSSADNKLVWLSHRLLPCMWIFLIFAWGLRIFDDDDLTLNLVARWFLWNLPIFLVVLFGMAIFQIFKGIYEVANKSIPPYLSNLILLGPALVFVTTTVATVLQAIYLTEQYRHMWGLALSLCYILYLVIFDYYGFKLMQVLDMTIELTKDLVRDSPLTGARTKLFRVLGGMNLAGFIALYLAYMSIINLRSEVTVRTPPNATNIPFALCLIGVNFLFMYWARSSRGSRGNSKRTGATDLSQEHTDNHTNPAQHKASGRSGEAESASVLGTRDGTAVAALAAQDAPSPVSQVRNLSQADHVELQVIEP